MFTNHDKPVVKQQNSQDASLLLAHFGDELKLPKAQTTIYLLSASTFDIGILPLIIEYLQPIIDEVTFLSLLKEYDIVQGREADFASCDDRLRNTALWYFALNRIAAHGNMGCLNFLLDRYPPDNIKKSVMMKAAESAAENRYTFIVERLLEVAAEEKKPDMINRVFAASLSGLCRDFGVFKWVMFRHRSKLEEYEAARLEREKNFPPEQKTPDLKMRIMSKTITSYRDPKKNPFLVLYQEGRVIGGDEPKIEVIDGNVEEKKDESLPNIPPVSSCALSPVHAPLAPSFFQADVNKSPLILEPVSEDVFNISADAKSSPAPQSSSGSCSLFLKMLTVVAITGGILLLIILHTPIGIAAGAAMLCFGALTFFAATRESKKADAPNIAVATSPVAP